MPIVGEPWHYQFYMDVLFENLASYHQMLVELLPQLESLSVLENKNQIKK